MELDLPMYKEAYKNIAIQIKELDNKIVDNETQIKRLEESIAENQSNIEKWGKVAVERGLIEKEEDMTKINIKYFDEYAEEYIKAISEAENQIKELSTEESKSENKRQIEENNAKRSKLKKHSDTVRENAKKDYEQARKEIEQEWEDGEDKKKYESKKESLAIFLEKKKENKEDAKVTITSEEKMAIVRLSKEIRELKQVHIDKLQKLDEQYQKFLQDLDDIDNGKYELEVQEVEEQNEEIEQENTSETNEQPTNTTTENTQGTNVPPTNTASVKGTNEQPTNTTTVNAQETNSQPENETNNEQPKFSYEFSMKGIKYDGQDLSPEKLLKWNNDYRKEIEDAIKESIGSTEKIDEFLLNADKLIYLSIISRDSERKNDGTIVLNEQAKSRLEEYYKVWANPLSQEESNMNITYDLRAMSKISRFFNGNDLSDKDVSNIRKNAYEIRNRKNVDIQGKLAKLQFKIKEEIENMRNAIKMRR